MTETDRRIASAKKQAVSYRNYRRARDRALSRLANAYPDTYKQLLAEEKAFDEEQGKKWVDIDGSTNPSMDIRTRTSSSGSGTTKGSSRSRKTRDDGGEA
jgi:hypothetical protein